MSSSRLAGVALFGLIALSSTSAFADWTVVRATGTAAFSRPDGTTGVLSAGAHVEDNVTVETGTNGRVMLRKDTSTIMVGPKSSFSIQSGFLSSTTTVLQQTGQLQFEVEKKNVRYFTVETPMMAALVKGTKFKVSVTQDRQRGRLPRACWRLRLQVGRNN